MNKVKTATMFFDSVTDLDCAVISEGRIIGKSLRISAEVTGPVATEEQVVIDFSACKKEMKRLIDDAETGLDHKFIYTKHDLNSLTGVNAETPSGKATNYIYGNEFKASGDSNTSILLKSDYADIEMAILDDIETLLETGLAKLVGLSVDEISVRVDAHSTSITDTATRFPFNYVHGLKNSTSYGCQNIIHGHSSFIEALDDHNVPMNVEVLVEALCFAKDSSFVVTTSDNAVNEVDGSLSIEYKSKGRGVFKMNTSQPHWVLSYPDTTVENLAHFIAYTHRADLALQGISKIRVSEGLSKGAVVDLTGLHP